MTIKTVVLLLITISTAAFSLKCFVCDDPDDKLCDEPKQMNCDVNQTRCYVINYVTLKWRERYVLKGCCDECSQMRGVNQKLQTSFDVECCEQDLCNGNRENVTESSTKENKVYETKSTKEVRKSESAKLKQRSVENKSEHTRGNVLNIMIAFYLSLVFM